MCKNDEEHDPEPHGSHPTVDRLILRHDNLSSPIASIIFLVSKASAISVLLAKQPHYSYHPLLHK